MVRAKGILPDDVVRSPFAHGAVIFLRLRADLDRAGATEVLQRITTEINLVTAEIDGARLASVAVGLGPTFFRTGDQPRFELDAEQMPSDFATLPALPQNCASVGGDIVIYVVTTAEAVLAQFLLGISNLHAVVEAVEMERGFQRANRRELGGFLDGLRNAQGNRESVVFVDQDLNDEPVWSDGGSYVAYLKISQDLAQWAALDVSAQEAIIGRHKADGSRVDLPAGTPVENEPEFTDGTCPFNAHVRKVGPRGQHHDATAFFRRGLPFVDLQPDGTVVSGLQFVSFQGTLDIFTTIFERWMRNPAFSTADAGPDALLAAQALQFLKGGFFFVPPHDDRFIGASLFDPPIDRCRNVGRIIIRKKVVDAAGTPVLAELGGIGFQLLSDGQAFGDKFFTNAHGHAISPEVPLGKAVVVHESDPPPNFTPAPDTEVVLDCRRHTIDLTNTAIQAGPGYAG